MTADDRESGQAIELTNDCQNLEPHALLVVELAEDSCQEWSHSVFERLFCDFKSIHQFFRGVGLEPLEACSG